MVPIDRITGRTRMSGNNRVKTRKVFERSGGFCVYCGQPALEADHVVPLSLGGPNNPSNLVPSCKSCNIAKSNTLDPKYLTPAFQHLMSVGVDLSWVDEMFK